DQHVHRRLRIHIAKREHLIIFPHDFRRNLTPNNFLEDRHSFVIRHSEFVIRDAPQRMKQRRCCSSGVELNRSRTKQITSSRNVSQERVQVFAPRRCFTHAWRSQSNKVSAPALTRALIRFSSPSKNASSY